jgi:hypothetical protein
MTIHEPNVSAPAAPSAVLHNLLRRNETFLNAPHMTFSTFQVENGRCFGFAVTDDGQRVYVSAALIKLLGFTADSVGIGFRARVAPGRPSPTLADPYPSVLSPVLLDEDLGAVDLGERNNAAVDILLDTFTRLAKVVSGVHPAA